MELKELIADLDKTKIKNFSNFKVMGVSNNSAQVKKGFIFVALKGENVDGADFVDEAIKNGAKAIVTQYQAVSIKCQGVVSMIKVKDTRKAFADLAAKFYNYPARKVKCIGVTGTNGKTTVTYLLESMLKTAGFSCGVIGTINYHFRDTVVSAPNTTPNPVFLESLLSKMQRQKVGYCAMEVSSHALTQERVRGIDFKYAIFTNLTSDHLDYHKNRHYYFAAKAKLFKMLNKEAYAIINIDDSFGRKLLKFIKARVITYGIERRADIYAEGIKSNLEGTEFKIKTPEASMEIKTRLIGRHNIYNILSAAAVAVCEGIGDEQIKKGIFALDKVAGRLQEVPNDFSFKIFVDYAHTEDALKNVLSSLNQLKEKRIIVVFGCGGDRDRSKRLKMGKVASDLADFAIVTSDNPRSEEPGKIIKEITRGMKKRNFVVVSDRFTAIEKALFMASAGDIVLIAGKGHEQHQIFKDKTLYFDDVQTVKKILAERSANFCIKNDPRDGFRLSEILEATKGKLIYGAGEAFVSGISSDSRTLKPQELFIALRGKNFDGHDYIAEAVDKGARIIVVDELFRLNLGRGKFRLKDCAQISFVRVEDTQKALGRIAQYHRRRFNIPLIAVTGSCGKTTTKDMIADVLSARFKVLKNEGTFNNFIGVPHTLLKLNKDIDIIVVELGTSRAGEIAWLSEISQPNVGIITNIGPSHLEFFGSVEKVLDEKYSLVKNLRAANLAILNADDNLLKKKIKSEKEKLIFTCGINNESDLRASGIKFDKGITEFILNRKYKFSINVLGSHNIYNALFAVTCGLVFGIDLENIEERLAHFILLSTRINIRAVKGYRIIDDTYNSNPLSLECAIEVLKNFSTVGRKVLVMGDMLELGEKSIFLHKEAGGKILRAGVDALITVGRFSLETARVVKSLRPDLKVYSCGCSLEARGILSSLLRTQDLVLVKGSRAMQMEKAIEGL